MENYARSLGEITPGCVTDFSVHCFNSETLALLASLGVVRATLHPELNLAQIRGMDKPIPVEAVIYGKIPVMISGNPLKNSGTGAYLTDRTGARFFLHGGTLYNSVPVYMGDKLDGLIQGGVTHGRFIFTDETAEETHRVINAYTHQTPAQIKYTRGKYFSKV
jgi:putative protease